MRFSKIFSLLIFFSLILVAVGCGSSETNNASQPETNNESQNEKHPEQKEESTLDFPKKPIKIIVPWAAGGGTDVFVRVVAELGPKYLGESIVVVNKEGAGGTVGIADAVNQASDGYNLVASSAGLFSTHPHLREVQYSLDDFIPIVGLQNSSQIFVVNGDSPYNTITELVEDAKKNNKTINYAAPGAMSVGHLAMSTFFNIAGVDAELVPFPGHAPAVAALLGSHVDAVVVFPSDVVEHVKDGNAKILGVFTTERLNDLPDVPTMIEQGFGEGVENHNFESWFFLAAPQGTPDEIVHFLSERFAELLNDPAITEYSLSAHQPIRPESSEDVLKRLTNEVEVYNGLIPKVNVQK